MNRRRATSILAAIAGAVSLAGTPASAQASTYYGSLNRDEALYCVGHLGDCVDAQDAADWALGVTEWRFGVQGHNDMADAFRHCAWNGAMAQRMGSGTAASIAANHERADGQPAGELAMDAANNGVGSALGEQSNSQGTDDTWGWILGRCESLARGYQLYGLDGRQGNY